MALQPTERKGGHNEFMFPEGIPGHQKRRKMTVQGVSPVLPVPGCPQTTILPSRARDQFLQAQEQRKNQRVAIRSSLSDAHAFFPPGAHRDAHSSTGMLKSCWVPNCCLRSRRGPGLDARSVQTSLLQQILRDPFLKWVLPHTDTTWTRLVRPSFHRANSLARETGLTRQF